MAKFKGVVKQCEICGSEFKVPPSRAETATCCSIKCASARRNPLLRKERVVLACLQCGADYEVHACHAHRRKFCSIACREASPSRYLNKREQNLREKNPMWVGGEVMHSAGYRYVYAPHHPFASNGYVFEHRLVMEEWLRRESPASPFLIHLGNQLYLSPDFVVHHRDENKLRNEIDNLECLTPSEHSSLHNAVRFPRKE